MKPIRSWGEIPDFDNEGEEAEFWNTHDVSWLFGYLPWWRRVWLVVSATFWYVVGFCVGVLRWR